MLINNYFEINISSFSINVCHFGHWFQNYLDIIQTANKFEKGNVICYYQNTHDNIHVQPKILREKRISSLNREKQYSYKKGVRLKCIGKAKEHGLE